MTTGRDRVEAEAGYCGVVTPWGVRQGISDVDQEVFHAAEVLDAGDFALGLWLRVVWQLSGRDS